MRLATMTAFESLRMLTQVSVDGWHGSIFESTIFFGALDDHANVLDRIIFGACLLRQCSYRVHVGLDFGHVLRTVDTLFQRMLVMKMNSLLRSIQADQRWDVKTLAGGQGKEK